MTSNVVAERDAPPRLPELDRLELALRRLLDAFEAQQQRAEQAEARVRELQGALQGVSAGNLDPMALDARVRQLEEENEALRERLRKAEAIVQRIHARLQFAEDER